MLYDAEQGKESSFNEATTGFIDILFGLIAILILALSVAASGLLATAQRLELTESSANAFVHLLRYEPHVFDRSAEIETKRLLQLNQFGNKGLSLYAVSAEGVIVLGPNQGSHAELFDTGASELPDDVGDQIVSKLRSRTTAFFPCFAPLDRSLKFSTDSERLEFDERIKKCESVYLAESASVMTGTDDALSHWEQPGLDLFVIEGHSDGRPPSSQSAASVAEARAQRVLYALLSDKAIEDVNSVNYISLPYEIDKVAEQLPGQDRNGYRSALLDLVPLSTRIMQECLTEYSQDFKKAQRTDWCDALLKDTGTLGVDSEGEKLQLRVPRIFAVSSYGRFSLRFGQLGKSNNRDRRVEFRFRPAVIPPSIHKLVRDQESAVAYYRLYSAASALTLHRCDLERGANESCVDKLEQLVVSGYVSGNSLTELAQ